MSKINWNLPKQEYISNPTVSLDELAKKYNISKRQVERVASEENWVSLRQEMSVKVQQKVGEKSIDKTAQEIVESKNQDVQAGKYMQALAIKAMRSKADGGDELRPYNINDARLLYLTGSHIRRKALGLDNKNINIEANVDGRRMYIVLPQKIKPEIPK